MAKAEIKKAGITVVLEVNLEQAILLKDFVDRAYAEDTTRIYKEIEDLTRALDSAGISELDPAAATDETVFEYSEQAEELLDAAVEHYHEYN